MSAKALITIHYSREERRAASYLLSLLSALQSELSDLADVLVYPGYGVEAPPQHTLDALQQAFGRVEVRSATRPLPPQENLDKAAERVDTLNLRLGDLLFEVGANFSEYKAVVALGVHACPITRDWLSVILGEWDASEPAFLGAWSPRNMLMGNPTDALGFLVERALIFRPDVIKHHHGLRNTPRRHSWAMYHAPSMKDMGWQGTYAIRSLPETYHITPEAIQQLRDEHVVLIHGVRDDSARRIVHP